MLENAGFPKIEPVPRLALQIAGAEAIERSEIEREVDKIKTLGRVIGQEIAIQFGASRPLDVDHDYSGGNVVKDETW